MNRGDNSYKLATLIGLAPYLIVLAIVISLSLKTTRAALLEKLFKNRISNYDFLCALPQLPPTIVMGSSTAKYGIDGRALNLALGRDPALIANVAEDAATPITSYSALARREAELGSVKMVIYSLDDWILSDTYYYNRPYERILWGFLEYFDVKKVVGLTDAYTAPYRHIIRAYVEPQAGCFVHPRLRDGLPFNDDSGAFKFVHLNLPPSDVQIFYLAKLKKLLESHGGKMLLFASPKTRQYIEKRKTFAPEAYEQTLKRKLIDALGADQKYWGSYDFANLTDDKTAFRDSLHMSPNGASVFSTKLGEAMKNERTLPTLGELLHF